jgi:cytochrome P450
MNETVRNNAPAVEPVFNPTSPDFIRNPYPFYQQLRADAPMLQMPFGAYLASRHADVSLVLRDRRFGNGKAFAARTIQLHGPGIMEEPAFRSMSHWMLLQDPPDHTRLRGLVTKAFTARRVEDMRPHPNQITAWKSQLEGNASEIFGPGGRPPAAPAVDVKSLHAKIGELTLENDS